MTTQTLNHGSASAFRPADRVRSQVQSAFMRLRQEQAGLATAKAIAALSADQLDDIGVKPRDEAIPVITVKAGLMANLMSLR